jgi:hypothetical protein
MSIINGEQGIGNGERGTGNGEQGIGKGSVSCIGRFQLGNFNLIKTLYEIRDL